MPPSRSPPASPLTRRVLLANAAAWLVAGTASAAEQRVVGRRPWLLFPLDPFLFRRVSSPYGTRSIDRHLDHHEGVDLAAPAETWIVAARGGTVDAAGWNDRAGWYARVTHAGGWRTSYCHMVRDPRPAGITAGEAVAAGEGLGRVGSTGRSSGPHLHFAVRDPDGRFVDPLPHLFTPAETFAFYQGVKP